MMAEDAAAALHCFAAAPFGNALILHGPPCPARDAILAALGNSLPLRRLPLHTGWDRLTGGTDIGRSITAGRMVRQPGILEAPGSVLVLASAERWDGPRAASLAAALDDGGFGLIALDEGVADEHVPAALAERAAFRIALDSLAEDFVPALPAPGLAASAAPPALPEPDIITALVQAALALGVWSPRAALMATRVAMLAAARAGRATASPEDAALAARLVLAHRATRMPAPEDEASPPEPPEQPDPPPPDEPDDRDGQGSIADRVLDAVRVVLPPDLLQNQGKTARKAGQAQARARARGHGRPAGSRPGLPRDGLRLDLIGTLRAAAPWQRLRGRHDGMGRLRLARDDLRVRRTIPRSATATIFAVDASGSQALNRLNEAKGAVEHLLAQCYIRRDSVALIGFRGHTAETLLPPTRAPARARACLALMPGGGGTPLAAGIACARTLAEQAVRRGEAPLIVLLTDGKANIAADGSPGRGRAREDALREANLLRESGFDSLLIDTAQRRDTEGEALARAMGARYLALPRADAAALSRAVSASRG